MNNPHRNQSDEAPAQADAVGNLENSTAQRAVRQEEMSDEDGGECHDSSFPLLEEIARNTRTKEDKGTADRVELVAVEEPPVPRKYFRYPRGTNIRRKKKNDTRKRRAVRTMSTGGRARAAVEQTTPSSFLDEKNKIATRSVQARAAREGTRSNCCASDEEGGRATATGVPTANTSLELEVAEEEPSLPPMLNEEDDGLNVPYFPSSGTTPPSIAPGAYRVGGDNVSTMEDESPQTMEDESSQIDIAPFVAFTVPEDPPLVPATRIEDDFIDEGGANESSPEDPQQPENSTRTSGKWGVVFRNRSVLMKVLVMLLSVVGLVSLSVSFVGRGGESSSSSSTVHPTSSPTIGPCGEGEIRFELQLVTDRYPDETSWVLTDGGGNIVWQLDEELEEKNKAYYFGKCLVDDCFTFRIRDSEGDGICCDHGEGHYSIDVDGQNVKRGGEFTSSEETLFGRTCSPTSSPISVPTSSPSSLPSYVPTYSPAPTITSSPTSAPTKTPWVQVGNDFDGVTENDSFGWSVSLSKNGRRLAIGAPFHNRDGLNNRGLVRVFRQRQGGDWIQLGDDLLGDSASAWFGGSVSISGNGERLAVGADGHDEWMGQVKMFQFESGNWNLLGSPLVGEAKSDWFGYSVSLSFDGTIVAVGARYKDGINGENSGHVRIFQYASGKWTQLGDDIDGEAAYDDSGNAVSLSSNGLMVAIGAEYNDGENGHWSGHVRVYTFESGSWKQVGQDIDGEAEGDWSGSSVSLSANGNIVAVGAHLNDGINGVNSGNVRVYKYDEGEEKWSQLGNDIDGEAAYDSSGDGWSVSLSSDGSVVAVGANDNDGNGDKSGHVRVHKFDGNDWVQVGADIDGEAAGDESGYSVSLSGDGNRVAIGAPYNDANGNKDSGHARVYKSPFV